MTAAHCGRTIIKSERGLNTPLPTSPPEKNAQDELLPIIGGKICLLLVHFRVQTILMCAILLQLNSGITKIENNKIRII